MDRLRGRVAVVTGASAGIGEAIAKLLSVGHGMKVVGCARRIERLLEREKSYAEETSSGGKFYAFKCDMEKDEDIKNMFQWIRDHPELGQVDVCICNAGISTGDFLSVGQTEIWRRMWNVNVVAASYCAQLAVNMMIEKGIKDGQVVFINSLCGHKTYDERKMVFYNSTKLALTCVVEGWRREVQHIGDNKIRISQVSPGLVETEIFYATKPQQFELSKQVFASYPHLKPEHVAFEVVHHLSAHPDMLVRDSIIGHTLEKF